MRWTASHRRPPSVLTDSALQASLTAVHVALAMLRRHRAGRRSVASPFVMPSFMFAATPWVLSAPLALAAGVGAHLVWLLASEILAPSPASARVPPPAAVPAPPRPPVAPPARIAAPKPDGRGGAPAFTSTPVLAVLEETPEIRTFRLARPEGFEFTAGQFVAVRVLIGGVPHIRCYSLSSSPDARGYLEISVRRQGLVSSTLHATVRPGASLAIKRPAGAFVYPAGDDRPLALIAGGVGVTPLVSMVRFAVSSDPTRPVTLLYSARTARDVAFFPELRLLAERHPHVNIAVTLTQDSAAAQWRTGRIDARMLQEHVAHPAHTIFCICGPGEMIAAVRKALLAIGVPADQIRSEKFETAAAAAVLNSAPAPVSPEPVAANAGHRVTFSVSGRTIDAPPSRTLLEAAEEEGIRITSSCRAGVCQACRTRLAEGDADCRSDMLDPADRAAGYILPCVSHATGDCVLEA